MGSLPKQVYHFAFLLKFNSLFKKNYIMYNYTLNMTMEVMKIAQVPQQITIIVVKRRMPCREKLTNPASLRRSKKAWNF